MKKIALALVLAAVSGAAMAEWVAISENDETRLYADPTTIRRSGSIVKMWTLYDLKSPQKNPNKGDAPFLSVKTQKEFDCKEERHRSLYFSHHSGKMGTGKVVFTNENPINWSPVPPGSIVGTVWEFACGKQ